MRANLEAVITGTAAPEEFVLVHGHLDVVPFDESAAHATGALRSATRVHGLSLGDRACLALCASRGATALTTDKVWAPVCEIIGIPIQMLR